MPDQKKFLYFLILLLSVGLVMVALGGGLWGQEEPWIFHWQHNVFQYICHQIPDRSFTINNQPMAVCSRCLGIYGGWSMGWILLLLLNILKDLNFSIFKQILIGTVLINLVDISGDLLNLWTNTLTSRLVLGLLLGNAAAGLFSGEFFNKK